MNPQKVHYHQPSGGSACGKGTTAQWTKALSLVTCRACLKALGYITHHGRSTTPS